MKTTRWAKLIRPGYGICLTAATYNHARILYDHGLLWDYGGIAPFYRLFWTSLTFLDAFAVILLMARPKAGLALAAAIIVSDLAINSCVGLTYGFDWPAYAAQFLFLIIVACTIRRAWRALESSDREEPDAAASPQAEPAVSRQARPGT